MSWARYLIFTISLSVTHVVAVLGLSGFWWSIPAGAGIGAAGLAVFDHRKETS